MSLESETTTFLAPSPSDVNIQDHNKRSKISYTREFLLSLAKADSQSTVKLPMEAQLSISCGHQDSPGLLSPPSCVPDSRCQKSMPQSFSLKVPDDVNHQLHRSNEPYRPPCRYKALPPSTGDSNDLLNGDTSGSSESTNQEKAEPERWRKDTVGVEKEDKWHSRQNTDSRDFSEEFLMSPSTRNSNSWQFTSNEINKQLYASWKPSLIQGAARGNAVQPSILPESTKNCSTRHQQVQDSITNETVYPWQTSVNHIDTPWHLSMLDNGMHLMESEDYSNFNVGQPVGTGHVMECLKKSRPTGFLSQENCEILKKKHSEVLYEQGIMGSQLSNASVCVHGSPGRIAIRDLSDAHTSPPPVEEEKQFISMVDQCESAMVHCEGILSLQDGKEAISVSMKQDPSTPDFQIQQELELNSSCSSLDGKSNSSSELCLPDEDSLITFDEPFWMPEVENSDVVDSFKSNPERDPNQADVSSPSSPRVIIEKLVESILNDESSPAPDLDDLTAHHGAGLDGFSHIMHAQQSYTQFCSSQLNQGSVRQDHNGFPKNSMDSGLYSLFSHSFPFNTISQPFPLSQNELRRFDHEVSQSIFQQQMINPGKLNLCSLCGSQSGAPPHLPAPQMAFSCTQKLNSIQGCLGYQDPSYGGFIRPNSDFRGDGDINQAAVDSFVDMKLQARLWHPNVGKELTQ